MNDDARFERLFADGLHELAPRRAPDRVRTTIRAQTGETRPRARWLALIKEPTMRTNNRLAVGSPTVRVAAIMAATLLAAMMIIGAGIAGHPVGIPLDEASLVELDPERVAQEAAILADRSDISEEIVRAASHLKQFDEIMHAEQPAGRKLNFLLQELNREFNTMGSKIGSAEIAHLIIDVKSELEKIREQIQNVE